MEVDTNHYSVPWRLIGETVTVHIVDESLRVRRAGIEVARHALGVGRRQRVIDPAHLAGVVGAPAEGGAANRRATRRRSVIDPGAVASLGRLRGDRRWLVNPDADTLPGLLARLQLTALRDRLDTLLDEAARREFNLREALTFWCQAEVARREQRRLEISAGLFSQDARFR